MADAFDKAQVVVGEVEVRLARPDERRRWDALMDQHHYLGFRQFAGRGLRHVAVWCGHWLALLGWQSGAFKCAPRDRWLGWHRSVQFRRLHLIGNNTRFLILPQAQGIANLASRVLGRSLRRVSADWEAAYGHRLELAETFVDPARFHGGAYDASNWVRVGRTKGFARHNGAYTDAHAVPKEMFVRPLRADARERLADPMDREEWTCRATPVRYTREELRSLRELFAEMPDCRRGQGMKHKLATVLSVCALARLAGVSGPAGTERFAKSLSQEELRALRAWRDPDARRWVAPSDSTSALDWDAPGVRHHSAPPEKGHGRVEARRLDAFTLPERVLSFEHARQAMRVMRERTDLRTGETTTETVYAITSVTPDRAGPEQLLAWNRGHWAVENANHYRRDASLGEDASRLRARHAPANNATLNNIALAIVFHRGFRHVPEANLHFMMRREDALDAILSPT